MAFFLRGATPLFTIVTAVVLAFGPPRPMCKAAHVIRQGNIPWVTPPRPGIESGPWGSQSVRHSHLLADLSHEIVNLKLVFLISLCPIFAHIGNYSRHVTELFYTWEVAHTLWNTKPRQWKLTTEKSINPLTWHIFSTYKSFGIKIITNQHVYIRACTNACRSISAR